MSRAGFLQRFIAFIIDMIIVGAVSGVLSSFYGFNPSEVIRAGGEAATAMASKGGITTGLIHTLLEFVYFGYFWSSSGQSLGMKLLGIKVINRNTATLLSFVMAGLRGSIGYWISSLICGLGYLWALWDSKGEAWHDKIFGTTVVRS